MQTGVIETQNVRGCPLWMVPDGIISFSPKADVIYFQDLNQQLEKKGKDKVDGTFMRKGKAGDWKAHFTPELEKRFTEWEDKWLRGSDLKFDYGL